MTIAGGKARELFFIIDDVVDVSERERVIEEFEAALIGLIEECAKIAARYTHPAYYGYGAFGVAVEITEQIRALKGAGNDD